MFKCIGKCDIIGIHTISLFVSSLCLLIYYFICINDGNNCNILLIFSMTLFGLFLIYLYVWVKNSTKKNKIHPILKKTKQKIKTKIRTVSPNENKYTFFKQKKEISFDQITI